MVNTRFDHRRPWAGDMAAYLRDTAPTNDEEISRLKRNLRRARQAELTPRQAQIMTFYFEQEKTVTQISRELGVSKSTVSRTLHRGMERLRRCLQYGL